MGYTLSLKGLTERSVINKHVVRNALIPVVTLVALQMPAVFGGAIVIVPDLQRVMVGQMHLLGPGALSVHDQVDVSLHPEPEELQSAGHRRTRMRTKARIKSVNVEADVDFLRKFFDDLGADRFP